MMVIIVLGTLAQKDMGLFAVQEKYFSSWFFWAWYLPLPGGRLTMILIFINLSFFFFNKNLWKINKLGIIILHLGGILLFVGGGLRLFSAQKGILLLMRDQIPIM